MVATRLRSGDEAPDSRDISVKLASNEVGYSRKTEGAVSIPPIDYALKSADGKPLGRRVQERRCRNTCGLGRADR